MTPVDFIAAQFDSDSFLITLLDFFVLLSFVLPNCLLVSGPSLPSKQIQANEESTYVG
jgi:hypothetical protein